MKAELFRIQCITNIHVGSGDINFDIVDNEVEKDPITGYPIIHGSSIKGALKDNFSDMPNHDIIFGKKGNNKEKSAPGTYKFLDAKLLARPLRVDGDSQMPFVQVTTIAAINDYLTTAKAFGINVPKPISDPNVNWEDKMFVSSQSMAKIEGAPVGEYNWKQDDQACYKHLTSLIGSENFAIAKNLEKISLPVIARNNIGENLWFEEYVPHKSVFWTLILHPDEEEIELDFSYPIQIGGNASVGCGYVQFEKVSFEGEDNG